MNIEKNTVVTLHYTMHDTENELIDQTEDNPIAYLHGGYDDIFPLVEEALHGKKVGDEITLSLSAEEAFGDIDETLIRAEPLKNFPVEVELGMSFESEDEDGEILIFQVVHIADGEAIIDANHPFAGLDITFHAKVVDVRVATDEEIEHQHPHHDDHCCGGHGDDDHECCGNGHCQH